MRRYPLRSASSGAHTDTKDLSSTPSSSSLSASSSRARTPKGQKQARRHPRTPSSAVDLTRDRVNPPAVPLQSLSIYRTPLTVILYAARFLCTKTRLAFAFIVTNRTLHLGGYAVALALVLWYGVAALGEKRNEWFFSVISHAWYLASWYGYWLILGILSSVGLGSGLHTFVLFLGPFIGKVAIAANSCHTLDFETIHRTSSIHCDPRAMRAEVTIPGIYTKVALEVLIWGLGTALGELPPYFVARHSQSTIHGELSALLSRPASEHSLFDRLKLFTWRLVKGAGFWGILLCASIPNPLFDLAGILCGTFGVPLATFLGATVLGKAVIKAGIQGLFVVALMSPGGVHLILSMIPEGLVKTALQDLIAIQSRKFRSQDDDDIPIATPGKQPNLAVTLAQWIWSAIVFAMLTYFVLKAMEGFANEEWRRDQEKEQRKAKGKESKRGKLGEGGR